MAPQRLLSGLAWLLLGFICVSLLPGSLPRVLAVRAEPGAFASGLASTRDQEEARQAWQAGRAAAAQAGRDRAAAQAANAGNGVTSGTPTSWLVPPGADGAIPPLALRAYRVGESWAAGFDPGCHLRWNVLAGIGRIESNHGRHAGSAARFSATGDVSPAILGPPLDGRGGSAAIHDSDGGRLDGNASWDQAVGPMQFLPSTWRSLGRDGNRDGVADPNNFFDASVSAAAYLCLAHGGDLSDPAQLRQAVYAYNHSWDYVNTVLGWASFYGGNGFPGGGPPVGAAAAAAPPGAAAGPGGGGSPATTATTRASTTSRRATTTTSQRRATTTTAGPAPSSSSSTSSSTTSTTAPCLPASSTTTSGSTTTTDTTTTTTTTLPPCP
ncbi:MAG TPA: lytic transglycosylase domain-containing protein [Actinomycetota bacterium]